MQNKDLFPRDNNTPLEVETVEINRLGAVPANIHRHPGLFILVIVNHSSDLKASFVIDTPEAGEGQLSPHPLLHINGLQADPRQHRSATLCLGATGELHLKSPAGKILCKLQFD